MKRPPSLWCVAQRQFEQAVSLAAANYWNAWVGAWTAWELAPGEQTTQDTELPLMGAKIPAQLTARHEGAAKEHDGCVQLSMRTRASGPAAARALADALTAIAGSGEEAAAKARAAIADLSFDSLVVAITDPDTLRPRIVRTERTMRVDAKDENSSQSGFERHVYEFAWGK